jgi:ribose 5-phosphate isomerase A
MTTNLSLSVQDQKRQAAYKAMEFVRNGMAIGLGTGSTMAYFIDLLGQKVNSGELDQISIVPTSIKTAHRAEELGIPMRNLSDVAWLDLAVDGADEVDPQLNLIKGMGRSLLREKIVELYARKFIVIVDESKLVNRLGTRSPLPVEIVPFEAEIHIRWLNTLGLRAELWLNDDNGPVTTDNGNYLALCYFTHLNPAGIQDPSRLSAQIKSHTGIVEHGLFLDMASLVVVAQSSGIRILERML